MNKSIHYYKHASSLNHPKAKNNLAMIYLKEIGIEKNELKNKQYAIELLKEAIKLNDPISMYNLAHIYFNDQNKNDENIEIIIDLLIKSSRYFDNSIELLAIIIINFSKNITFEMIKNKIKTNKNINYDQQIKLAKNIYKFIVSHELNDPIKYQNLYNKTKNLDYIYNYDYQIITTNSLIEGNKIDIPEICKNIDENFYEGFGITFN